MNELTKTLMKLAGFDTEREKEFYDDDLDDYNEDFDDD